MWLMVFARGLMVPLPDPRLPTLPDTEFLRTRAAELGGKPVVLSRRALRGRVVVAPCWCSFCWCRNSKSRRAKHLVHCGHSKGFSLVCDRSWRFRCSRRANDRVQVVQTWGLGLSVLGGGKLVVVGGCEVSGFAVCTDAGALLVGPQCGPMNRCHSLWLLPPLLPESSLGVLESPMGLVLAAAAAMLSYRVGTPQTYDRI
jgi:hypothetical protein